MFCVKTSFLTLFLFLSLISLEPFSHMCFCFMLSFLWLFSFFFFVLSQVHLPLTTYGFYYLLVVNFRLKLFEVLYPNTKFRLVSDHVEVAIKNFKMAFNLSCKHSLVKVDSMHTIYMSVCSSEKRVCNNNFITILNSIHGISYFVIIN
jgi:hypothetical protein